MVGTPKRRSLDSTIGEELYGAGTDVDAGMNMDPVCFWGSIDVEMLGTDYE